jgi:hypothetical protein
MHAAKRGVVRPPGGPAPKPQQRHVVPVPAVLAPPALGLGSLEEEAARLESLLDQQETRMRELGIAIAERPTREAFGIGRVGSKNGSNATLPDPTGAYATSAIAPQGPGAGVIHPVAPKSAYMDPNVAAQDEYMLSPPPAGGSGPGQSGPGQGQGGVATQSHPQPQQPRRQAHSASIPAPSIPTPKSDAILQYGVPKISAPAPPAPKNLESRSFYFGTLDRQRAEAVLR